MPGRERCRGITAPSQGAWQAPAPLPGNLSSFPWRFLRRCLLPPQADHPEAPLRPLPAVSIHTGAATVTPQQYVQAVAALQPDLWVALSDDIPNDSRSDRCAKSADRTAAWLPACLAAAAATPALAGAGVLAAVQGGQYVNERIRCAEVGQGAGAHPAGQVLRTARASMQHPLPGTALCVAWSHQLVGKLPHCIASSHASRRCPALPPQAAAKQPGLAGVVVAALGTGESPELRGTIIKEVTARFPAGALRMASCVGTPEEVLEAVAQVGVGGKVGRAPAARGWAGASRRRARGCAPSASIAALPCRPGGAPRPPLSLTAGRALRCGAPSL